MCGADHGQLVAGGHEFLSFDWIISWLPQTYLLLACTVLQFRTLIILELGRGSNSIEKCDQEFGLVFCIVICTMFEAVIFLGKIEAFLQMDFAAFQPIDV